MTAICPDSMDIYNTTLAHRAWETLGKQEREVCKRLKSGKVWELWNYVWDIMSPRNDREVIPMITHDMTACIGPEQRQHQ